MEPTEQRATALPAEAGLKRGRFHWPTFAADAALVSGGALAANVLNYVFHFALSRKLGPSAYGSLASLLAIAMVVGVVGSTLGTVAMQETARLWASHRDAMIGGFAKRTIRYAAIVGAGAALLIALLAIPLSHYLRIDDLDAWMLLGLALAVGIIAAYARGAVQGAHRFGVYAGSLIADSGVKLLLGLALVSAGFGVAGAMGAVAGGLLTGATVATVSLLRRAELGETHYTLAQFGGPAIRLSVIYTASMALIFVDTIFAKHGLRSDAAGYYTAAGLVARIIPFGVGLIVPLITPKAVAAKHSSRAALAHLLFVTFGAAVLGTAVVLAVMEIWPDRLIAITFGPNFAPAAQLLRVYAIDTSLIALGLLGYSYLAAVAEYGVAWWLAAAVVLEAGAMALWGDTPNRLLGIAIAGNSMVLPAIVVFVLHSLREAPQTPQAESPPHAEVGAPSP